MMEGQLQGHYKDTNLAQCKHKVQTAKHQCHTLVCHQDNLLSVNLRGLRVIPNYKFLRGKMVS